VTCPADCGTCGACGDGLCDVDQGESCGSCVIDCACGACDDGTCDPGVGESQFNCPGDCGCSAGVCGGAADGGCFCDALCQIAGDCCWDACTECGFCS
jgi:hypothetical protein